MLSPDALTSPVLGNELALVEPPPPQPTKVTVKANNKHISIRMEHFSPRVNFGKLEPEQYPQRVMTMVE